MYFVYFLKFAYSTPRSHNQTVIVRVLFHTTHEVTTMLKIGDSLIWWYPERPRWSPPEDAEVTARALDLLRDAVRQAEARELAALADLDEANAKLRGYSWQPIETAPHDRVIMLYRPSETGFRQVATGRWESDKYAKHPKPYWKSLAGISNVRVDRATPPTHWMNLPEPPAEVTP